VFCCVTVAATFRLCWHFGWIMSFFMRSVCCLLLLLVSPAWASRVYIHSGSIRLTAEYLPSSKGPAVVLLHGCGGMYAKNGAISARIQRAANWFQELGIGVLMLDSFGARGIKDGCSSRAQPLDEVARADDAEAALAWLRRHKHVDGDRLGVMGWSHGADAALELVRRSDPDIRAAVVFYPACSKFLHARKFRIAAPTLLLIGESDEWTSASDCKALSKKSRQDLFHIVTYPGVYHDFDSPNQVQYMRNDVPNQVPNAMFAGEKILAGPNPEAALDANLRTFKWFSRWFDPERMLHGIPPVNMLPSGEPIVTRVRIGAASSVSSSARPAPLPARAMPPAPPPANRNPQP
jgi:dienelactone hydrolase